MPVVFAFCISHAFTISFHALSVSFCLVCSVDSLGFVSVFFSSSFCHALFCSNIWLRIHSTKCKSYNFACFYLMLLHFFDLSVCYSDFAIELIFERKTHYLTDYYILHYDYIWHSRITLIIMFLMRFLVSEICITE